MLKKLSLQKLPIPSFLPRRMSKPFKYPYSLLLTVFITGAAVLVIEVTATRLLSPHFGMTLFTLSSILSTVLGALSLGYWVGGKLADRYPRPLTLYYVILAAGVTTLLIHVLQAKALPAWSSLLDIMTGPLVASLVLFFTPTFFLGMVSPIAIRLSVTKLTKVGEVTGRIFFFGTLGSIAGSLMAGFVLIPRFLISQILIGTSLLLVGIGLFGIRKSLNRNTWILLSTALILAYVSVLNLTPDSNEALLHEEDSMYQHIRVVKHEFPEGEGRILMLDRTYAGAGYTSSKSLPFAYTRYYKLYELVNAGARRFLYLGGGAYTTPLKLLDERDDDIEVDVVEIDSKLPVIAREYFGLRDDSRLNIIIEDARKYLTRTPKRYDLIFIDVYSQDIGIPAHLMSQEFFQLVKNHLNEKSTVVMNVAANIDLRGPSLGLSAIQTFRTVFPKSEFIALAPQDITRPQNIMFWGVNDESWQFDVKDPNIVRATSKEINNLPQHRINLSKIDFKGQITFTDDYAPIEYLVAKMLKGKL